MEYKILMLVYRCIHNLTPMHLRKLCELKPPREGLRSVSNVHSLVAGLAWWSNLPNYIKLSSTIDIFKRNLKTFCSLDTMNSSCSLQYYCKDPLMYIFVLKCTILGLRKFMFNVYFEVHLGKLWLYVMYT